MALVPAVPATAQRPAATPASSASSSSSAPRSAAAAAADPPTEQGTALRLQSAWRGSSARRAFKGRVKKYKHRGLVANEIVETERSYW